MLNISFLIENFTVSVIAHVFSLHVHVENINLPAETIVQAVVIENQSAALGYNVSNWV